MYNWSVDTTELEKDGKEYAIWRLEQMVNFGLGGETISRAEILKHWKFLHLDQKKKNYLEMLLWPKRS